MEWCNKRSLKNISRRSVLKADPIDTTIPPILRGFWQGGDTFVIDTVSGKLATEYTPIETRKETSITNVHNILYWIDRNNPLKKVSGNKSSSLFLNWEYGVQNWWAQNSYKYKKVTEYDIPNDYDDIHTEKNKPEIKNVGLLGRSYKTDESVDLNIKIDSRYSIKKIDIFINSTYLTSLQNGKTTYSFIPKDIVDISKRNTVNIIAHDIYSNNSQASFYFDVE